MEYGSGRMAASYAMVVFGGGFHELLILVVSGVEFRCRVALCAGVRAYWSIPYEECLWSGDRGRSTM